MSTVLIIGVGDMGERLAAGLAAEAGVRRLVLAGRSQATVAAAAAGIASSSDCLVEAVRLDAERVDDVAELLVRTAPDLVVQCAALRSPWALAGREDEVARGIIAAGLALRLPYQLPVVLAVMRAAQLAGYSGPVANLSFPDVTGPILRSQGLAPTLGLGNAGMVLRRVRAALRTAEPGAEPPLVRILGQHAQVFDVMQAREPADPEDRCRVYLDEDGRREDALAYRAPALEPGVRYNPVTAAAALPVLGALLPGAAPLRWSTPAPLGLPGGYPVRIANGSVALDLPPGLTVDQAVAFNERMGRGDGVERIDEDGTVHFTPACREAVADFAPDLAEPLAVGEMAARAARLDALLG
ncbi:saccharopine dehydrogenase NADP-binding domain-containing protein [Kitasatospora sp. NPDC048239]|uniref:saccharopine dehydrogenase NADP-binding domain-containing protein n=1 Tax=Kitasatospora sp. NPDC048239 TaxID=3364046 RepID=UPI00371E601F